jgi:pilus assembly protein Flp/PilA
MPEHAVWVNTNEDQTMKAIISRFAKDESGATAIEYGLIAGLISIVIIGAVTLSGTNLTTRFNTIANSLT